MTMNAQLQGLCSPKRCLIVEDNPIFAKLIGDAVQKMGLHWQVEWEATGLEGLESLKHYGPKLDMVLIDLGLPDISGQELIRTCHAHYPDIPIMVITVIATERSLLDAIRQGAKGYVLKDDSLLSIQHALISILEGNYPISPSLAHYLFKMAGSPIFSGPKSFPKLTTKETNLLKLLALGHSYDIAGGIMDIKLTTVQFHIRNVYKKLQVHSQAQALCKAQNFGLLEPPPLIASNSKH